MSIKKTYDILLSPVIPRMRQEDICLSTIPNLFKHSPPVQYGRGLTFVSKYGSLRWIPPSIHIYYEVVTSYVDNYPFENSGEYFFNTIWRLLLMTMHRSCILVFAIFTIYRARLTSANVVRLQNKLLYTQNLIISTFLLTIIRCLTTSFVTHTLK